MTLCKAPYRFLICSILLSFVVSANGSELTVKDEEILYGGEPIKILGLRCSNALLSDETTADVIASLDLYRSYGLNTISVFLMGSRFGDIKGYLPDSSLNPVYANRLQRILDATAERKMIAIVGCLYWSTSRAKEDLGNWGQSDADRAVSNTARWLKEKGYTHVILDPDNEGMAVRAEKWAVESMIRAAKEVNPELVVANNTKQNPPNEDLNMHFGEPEPGKPWFDSEATPGTALGGYWGKFSKESHMAKGDFYNYSRVGRYTVEMKEAMYRRTIDEVKDYNGFVLASTWLQCGPAHEVEGPFAFPGGRSKLGSGDDKSAPWNQNIDELHPAAGILWWLEFVKDSGLGE